MSMGYETVLQTAEKLQRHGWQVQEMTKADGYPILLLTDPYTARGLLREQPTLLVAAGIHGEEPAAVLGLQLWLEEQAQRWEGEIGLHVWPCLNPYGFERGVRFAANGRDLNREFDRPHHPVVQAFVAWSQGRTFHLFMDLHEDSDFTAMYLYELIDPGVLPSVTLGRKILDEASQSVPLSDGDDVGGGILTENGWVRPGLTREAALAFRDRPIAIEVYARNAPHVVTVETPGKLDITLRRNLHAAALQLACRHLTSQMPF